MVLTLCRPHGHFLESCFCIYGKTGGWGDIEVGTVIERLSDGETERLEIGGDRPRGQKRCMVSNDLSLTC